MGAAVRSQRVEDWLYAPVWQRRVATYPVVAKMQSGWVVFADTLDFYQSVLAHLPVGIAAPVVVLSGNDFEQRSAHEFVLDTSDEHHYQQLFTTLSKGSFRVEKLVYLSSLGAPMTGEALVQQVHREFKGLFNLCRVLSGSPQLSEVELNLVTNDGYEVTSNEDLHAGSSPLMPLGQVLQQECAQIRFYHIDVTLEDLAQPHSARYEEVAKQVALSLSAEARERELAIRGKSQWLPLYQRYSVPAQSASRFKDGGVYVILGGLGQIGLAMAAHLAQHYQSKLVLTSRRGLPARTQWAQLQADVSTNSQLKARLEQLQALESQGAEVTVLAADVCDEESLRAVFEQTRASYGRCDGVIHSAANIEDSMVPLQSASWAQCEAQFAAKVQGTLLLEKVLADEPVDFCLLMSSLASVLGGLGFAAYGAANMFMDTFVQSKQLAGDRRWLSINWDGWHFDKGQGEGQLQHQYGFTAAEGIAAWSALMKETSPAQLLVSSGELMARKQKWQDRECVEAQRVGGAYQRPELSTAYREPTLKLERQVVDIWENLLGIEGIGIDDNFFELDGDSLLLTRVVSQINRQWKISLSLQTIFEHPTVAEVVVELAKLLTMASASKDDAGMEEYEEEVL
jgi:NAD(P)-dependent dehydrogenase (short-subunit alcohol dehydrogenase family)/acyl carrier protein